MFPNGISCLVKGEEKKAMKNRIGSLSYPVISFLSPSPSASRKAQSILSKLCGLEKVKLTSATLNDNLNSAFTSVVPGFSQTWDSVALKCSSTGAILHFLSGDKVKSEEISLLGLTESIEFDSNEEAIRSFRDLLALHMNKRSSSITIKSAFGVMSIEDLLCGFSHGGLPLLSLPQSETSSDVLDDKNESYGLKEISVPYFDFAEYTDGSTLLSRFSKTKMKRPVVGVYKWGSNRIRPLPTASEDRVLPPPSLVFHCKNLEGVNIEVPGARTSKIGYGGNRIGQMIVQHEALSGLDVRFCSNTTVSSSFCEAQESLLAASLSDLQSTNTLLKGGEEAKDDDRIGKADCWVEVRANLKQPSGFLKRPVAFNTSTQRIAEAPSTPDA